jgi:putative ABC transport system permease protein
LAGLLIIASAALATRMARIREAVYYKILGAKKRFILHTFMIEHLMIGFLSGMTALIFSHMFSFLIIRKIIGVSYHISWTASAVCLTGVVLMMLIIGFVSSLPVLKQKPALFLRQHAME